MVSSAYLKRHPVKNLIIKILYKLLDHFTKCPHERLSETKIGQTDFHACVVNEWAYKICLDCDIEILQPHERPDFVKRNRKELLGWD